MDAAPTDDGGLILVGYRGFWSTNNVWLARTDSVGDTLWSRTYGDSTLSDGALSVSACPYGSFIIVGYRGWGDNHEPNDSAVVYVLKVNDQGDTLWTRTYGRWGSIVGWKIKPVASGGFIVCGATNYFEHAYYDEDYADRDSSDIFLLRISDEGDSLWFRTYGTDRADEGFSMSILRDGGYAIVGVTAVSGSSSADVYVVRTDSLGSQLWEHTWGHPGIVDVAYAVDTTYAGGLYISGESYITPGSEAYILNVDGDGNLVWDYNYRDGFSRRAFAIRTLPGDNFVTAIIRWFL